jgi:hypothetical protein
MFLVLTYYNGVYRCLHDAHFKIMYFYVALDQCRFYVQ